MSSEKLKHHVLFTHYDEVVQICAPLQYIGIDGFIYIKRFSDGSFIDLSTKLEWSEYFLTRYLNEKYLNSDIQDHMLISKGVSLWELNPDNVIWQEGKQYFGYGNGVSICKDRGSYVDIFCFYTKASKQAANQFYINHMNILEKFSDYFLEKAVPIISKGSINKLWTPKSYLNVTKMSSSEKSFTSKSDLKKFLIKIDNGAVHDTCNSVHLTKRELDCLRHLMEGKSGKQIGKLLNISPRTVETHLNRLKTKFNCRTRLEIVGKLQLYAGSSFSSLILR